MKKIFYCLMALFVVAVVFVLEGGSMKAWLGVSAIIAFVFPLLFTSLFTYKYSEIVGAIKNAFSNELEEKKISEYKKGIMIAQNISTLAIQWAFTVVITAAILIFSTLTTPQALGRSLSAACLVLLYALLFRTVLFIPMEQSLGKKVFELENRE
ncbi:MAG: hypothetical protein ACM3UU_08770 [Ignavibacteriales bacterium]